MQVDYKKRLESNGIKPEKLLKVNRLLAALHGSVESSSLDGMSEGMKAVKTKMAAVHKLDGAQKVVEVSMAKYHQNMRNTGSLGPTAIAAYVALMKDKDDLTRMPIGKKTRTRQHNGLRISVPVFLKERQATEPEEPIVEVLAQSSEDQEASASSQQTEDSQRETHMRIEANGEPKPTEWVMCTLCTKWRILPPEVHAASLHVKWTCGIGFQSRPHLDCHTPYDLDTPQSVLANHQKKQAPCRTITRQEVTLQDDEKIWLLNECGLRPCYTWADGYSGYRCLAALRDTTMKNLIKDVLSALLGQEGEQNTRMNVMERKKELQRVLIALSESYVKLSRHYHCRDDMFSIVAKMDDMCIILVNTIPENEQLRYRVYTPTGVTLCPTLQEVQDIIQPLRYLGKSVRGVGFGTAHFCALYPADEDPNFAGPSSIDRWD